jgi:hypothetical protein
MKWIIYIGLFFMGMAFVQLFRWHDLSTFDKITTIINLVVWPLNIVLSLVLR